MIYIVTRHEGAVEWLRSKGYDGSILPHLEHEQIAGENTYIGVLPIPMVKAILDAGSRFLLLSLPDVAFSQRGASMTPAEMDLAGAHLTEVKSIELASRKKAILFGGTDGHGATMTAISERNLEKSEYEVTTVCNYERHKMGTNLGKSDLPSDCGTGFPEYFWGFTFLNYDFSGLHAGDIIVVVDIPLPIRVNLSFSAADEAIEKISKLREKGIRTILIDHHKRAIMHYGKAIERGAEVIFSLGAEQYCYYGAPDAYSRFWGTLGAICDRDPSTLPVEDDEKEPFEEMERYAAWIDLKKRDLSFLLETIRHDKRESLTSQEVTLQPPNSTVEENVTVVDDSQRDRSRQDLTDSPVKGNVTVVDRLTEGKGFKELDAACARDDTLYGVGINHDCSAIQVINYWKRLRPEETNRVPALPVALRLAQHRNPFGHDAALTIKLKSQNCEIAKEQVNEIVRMLNSRGMKKDTSPKNKEDAIDYIASAFSDVPTPYFLTMHGWSHVEAVLDSARILGLISGLTPDEQRLLDWSVLCHDLGNGAMAYKEKYGLIVSDNDDGAEARDKHELYTVQILTGWNREGIFQHIIGEEDLRVICDMCYRHRKRSALPKDPKVSKLCSLLRVADALDRTRNRARYNDNGEPYSQVREKLPPESIKHWEAQRAIDAIRLHVKKSHIAFEFLVTDVDSSKFIIDDFEKELAPLEGIIPSWDVLVTTVPK
jgi:CRISPR-associated protein Csx16